MSVCLSIYLPTYSDFSLVILGWIPKAGLDRGYLQGWKYARKTPRLCREVAIKTHKFIVLLLFVTGNWKV